MSIERIACIECDLVVSLGALAEGERARCPRCRHLLSARTPNGLNRALAYAVTAVVLLVMANAFPFLALSASGLESVMSLPKAALQLYQDGYGEVALLVLGVTVIVPAVMLALIIALTSTLARGYGATWQVNAGRALFSLTPWSMAEVFVIAVLVSLVKVGSLATVVMGIAFWAYIAFAMCLTGAVSSLDRLAVWREIERLRT